jgi:hypothetical protein
MAHGWEAGARGDALNTVRSALAHLAAWGEIERIRRGVYRIQAPQSRKPIPPIRDHGYGAELTEATG